MQRHRDEPLAPEVTGEVPAAPAGMTGAPGLMLRLVKDYRVAFLIVGVANTVIGFLWFALFDALYRNVDWHVTIGGFDLRLDYLITLASAHVLSVLCAFVLYRRFVFRVRGHVWIDLGRFEMVYLVALGVNAVLLTLLSGVFHMQPLLAQALIVLVTTMISFFGHREFSFRRKKEGAQ